MQSIQRSKGTIRFSFKEAKTRLQASPKKDSLIMLHFTYGRGQRFKYSTGYHSCYSDWDYKKQRLRNKAHLMGRNNVNDFLNKIETELYKEISQMDSQGLAITNKRLKQKLDVITGKVKPKESERITLFSYFDKFCQRKEGKIQETTLRSYKQTRRLLFAFNAKLDFDDIDLNFYDEFVVFLEDDDKSLNTIGKHIKNLKVVLGSATKDGYSHNLAYTRSDFKVPTESTTAIYLDEGELKKMTDLKLNGFPKLAWARDIFLIGCYTGQRVSDYNGLTNENIVIGDEDVRLFKIKQKKTGKIVYCPITLEIQAILDKYDGSPPKKMNEQDINEYIKQVGKKAGITENITCNKTKGGKQINEQIPKYKMIGTHTARRSFCTNMFKKGMPTYNIMEFSGHSTEREFYKYIRIEKEQKAISLAKSGYFNI